MDFNSLNWHDSIIKAIIIDRSNPGNSDSIKIEISWPNGENNIISFINTYWADLNMNFGIECPESILCAHSEGRENETLVSLYAKWNGMINDVELYNYEIETNSTNSKIRIIAQSFEIIVQQVGMSINNYTIL